MGLTKIEWTSWRDANGVIHPGFTFNPWIGCQKVSPGCDHCYAEALMDTRYGKVEWGPHGERKRTSEANWKLPLRWAKAARDSGERPRVFCASLADWLDNQVPQQWRVDLAHLIHATPELDWLLLSKRIENFARLSPWPAALDGGGQIPFPKNVWLGVTAEDDLHYTKRWNILSRIPAAVRFISYEPAIGPLGTLRAMPSGKFPDWIICGGESGAKPRTMSPEWARDMRDACELVGIPFFMKQMSGKAPIPPDLMVRQFPRAREARA